jgi:hypothetical protein
LQIEKCTLEEANNLHSAFRIPHSALTTTNPKSAPSKFGQGRNPKSRPVLPAEAGTTNVVPDYHLSHAPAARPLCLKPRPIPIEVVSVVPDGPPIHFRWQAGEHFIQGTWGPERIETGWWRGPHVQRDYYRVETATGQRFWLFRQNDTGKWFLHGAFE